MAKYTVTQQLFVIYNIIQFNFVQRLYKSQSPDSYDTVHSICHWWIIALPIPGMSISLFMALTLSMSTSVTYLSISWFPVSSPVVMCKALTLSMSSSITYLAISWFPVSSPVITFVLWLWACLLLSLTFQGPVSHLFIRDSECLWLISVINYYISQMWYHGPGVDSGWSSNIWL